MKSIKRRLSLLLILALLMGVFNLSVFAESPSPVQDAVSTADSADSSLNVPEVEKVLEITITPSEGESKNLKLYLTENNGEISKEYIQSNLPAGYSVDSYSVRELTPEERLEVEGFEYYEGMSFDDGISPQFIETIFDIGSLVISFTEFITNPTFWNGFNVVVDGAAVIVPGVPSINGAKRMIQASPILADSMRVGIMTYGNMRNKTVPSGWQRHHIFEKRFASNLGVSNTDNMLSIAIPYSYHYEITQLMRTKYPYGQDWSSLSRDQVLNAHINAYTQLFKNTNDPVWEFLAEFSRHRQVVAKPRNQD